MKKRFLYQAKVYKTFLQGLYLPFLPKTLVNVPAERDAGNAIVWRTDPLDNYKMTSGYADSPLELSNYMTIRMRELIAYSARQQGTIVTESPIPAIESQKKHFVDAGVLEIEKDVHNHLGNLHGILNVLKPEKMMKLPVAFATNTWYVLQRTGVAHAYKNQIETLLVPLIKAKAEFLHAEGIAHAVYAAGVSGWRDNELWEILEKAVLERKYAGEVLHVVNSRFSATHFEEPATNTSLLEKDYNDFAHGLFYKDNLCLFELQDGLKEANSNGARDTSALLEHM